MGKNIYRFLIIILVLLSKSVSGNWQYWSHYEVVGSVSDNLDFKVKPELRYDDNSYRHYHTFFDIGFDWSIAGWFVLAPCYRHVNEKRNEVWEVEYRPHLNAIFKWKPLRYFNLSDRNRIELRIKEENETLRYRNKLAIKMPKFTKLEIQTQVAEEFFYDFDSNEVNKNRIYAGVDFKAIKYLKIGLYYILESRKSDNTWSGENIFQSSLKYGF